MWFKRTVSDHFASDPDSNGTYTQRVLKPMWDSLTIKERADFKVKALTAQAITQSKGVSLDKQKAAFMKQVVKDGEKWVSHLLRVHVSLQS